MCLLGAGKVKEREGAVGCPTTGIEILNRKVKKGLLQGRLQRTDRQDVKDQPW